MSEICKKKKHELYSICSLLFNYIHYMAPFDIPKGPESTEAPRPQEASSPVDIEKYGRNRKEQSDTITALQEYDISRDVWESIKVGVPNAQINSKWQIVDWSKVLADLATIEKLRGKIMSVTYKEGVLLLETGGSNYQVTLNTKDTSSIEQQLGIPVKKDTMKKFKEEEVALPEWFTRFLPDENNPQITTEFTKYGLNTFDGIDRLFLEGFAIDIGDKKGYEEYSVIEFDQKTAWIKVGPSEKGGLKIDIIRNDKAYPTRTYHIIPYMKNGATK